MREEVVGYIKRLVVERDIIALEILAREVSSALEELRRIMAENELNTLIQRKRGVWRENQLPC